MRRENRILLDLADEKLDDFRFWHETYLASLAARDSHLDSDRDSFYWAKSCAEISRSYIRSYARGRKAPNVGASGASD